MKQIITVLTCILLVCAFNTEAQIGHSFILVGLASHKVPVSFTKMTNLIFPVNIRKGIKVSRQIAAQKVQGVENVIEVKALRANFTPTNLSVFGVDGRLYSFDLQFVDDSSTSPLNFEVVNRPDTKNDSLPNQASEIELTGLPVNETVLANDMEGFNNKHGFLNKSISLQRMRLTLKGIYIKDSLLWLVMHVKNHSLIPYPLEYLRLNVIDRKRVKRTAVQTVTIEPVFSKLPTVVKDKESFAIAFPPFTIANSKKLLLEIAERNGGRLLQLTIKNKTLLKARKM
jgi:conjugative transposon TraN protein